MKLPIISNSNCGSTRMREVASTGSMMRLSKILGHSSVEVTERYTHLLPDSFRESEFAMLSVDLAAGGELFHMKSQTAPNGAIGYVEVTQSEAAPSKAV